MKILQVTSFFPPHIGGLEKCVYNISKGLVGQGHQIIVYTTNSPKSKTYELKDGIVIHRIPVFLTAFGAPIALFFPYMIKEDVDLVHVHIPPIFGALSSVVISKVKKMPMVLTYHNDTVGSSAIQNFIAKIYNIFLIEFILKNATLITVPSRAYKIELGTRGIDKSKIRVVNNGVDFFEKNKQTDADEIEKRFKFHGKKLVLFVGALEKRKGVEFLIKAVPRIGQKIQNVKVIVVGNGSEKVTLENLAGELDVRNKVLFTGYLKEEDVHALYSMADVFVLPSLYETFSLVLLEAMAHGKPIVTTRILGTTELVKPDFNGVLVDPKDSESLADAIVKVLSEGDYARHLGENGEQFSKNFTWDRTVTEYMAVYNELYAEHAQVENNCAQIRR